MKTQILKDQKAIFEQGALSWYSSWDYKDPISRPESTVLVKEFPVASAINYGVQGERFPSITREGIEGIICCSSLIGSQ